MLHDRLGFTHRQARGLIDAGAVREDGARGSVIGAGDYARRVAAGERYRISFDETRGYRPRPGLRRGEGYRVVHDERELLVVEKQPRLLSVPTPLREDEDSLVERMLESERRRGVGRPALYLLNRLDWDTSGLLLFARTRRAFEALEEQFRTRTITRLYTAVAEGRVGPDEGRFETRLVEDRRTMKMRPAGPDEGKDAITEYRVTDRLPEATVLSVRLRTGRRNQIRIHFAEAGHPLFGDRSYGRATPLIGRTALHARALKFVHPVTGRPAAFESPLPADMRKLIRALRAAGVAASPPATPVREPGSPRRPRRGQGTGR